MVGAVRHHPPDVLDGLFGVILENAKVLYNDSMSENQIC
jgi:hypothetical protein